MIKAQNGTFISATPFLDDFQIKELFLQMTVIVSRKYSRRTKTLPINHRASPPRNNTKLGNMIQL